MTDVLGNEPRAWPRWVGPVVLLGLVVGAIAFSGQSQPPRAARATSSPSPSPRANALPQPGTAGSACGGDVALPVYDSGLAPHDTGLRLLVGDRELRVVDVDAARVKVLRTVQPPITSLARLGGRTYALIQDRCSAHGYGQGVVVPIDTRTGTYGRGKPGDELLSGTPATVIDYDSSGAAFLRELGTGRQTLIPSDWAPVARRGSEYVVYVQPASEQGVGALGTIGVGDPATGRLTRTYGAGSGVVAASGANTVWLAGGCDPGPCLLSATGNDGIATAQHLDGSHAWGGALSPDGRFVAFRLARREGRLGAHPGPPNDVAVADLRTGSLTVLPGLVLPPKAGLTLTWSTDSWLAIGADLGTGHLLLLWREGMERPAQVPLPPTGGGTTGPPALVFLDQSR